MTWTDLAPCKGHQADFYPPTDKFGRANSPEGQACYERAKAICASCPFRERECMVAGWDEYHGVWFGTTPPERVKLRKQFPRPGLPPRRCLNARCPLPGRMFVPKRNRQIVCSQACKYEYAAVANLCPWTSASSKQRTRAKREAAA